MKKTLSLLLCLLLLAVSAVSLAEGELTQYVDPDGRFSFHYPQNWTVLSYATLDAVIAQAEADENIGLKMAADAYTEAVQDPNSLMLLHARGVDNMTMAIMDVGMELTDDMVETLVAPMLVQQLTDAGVALSGEASIIDANGHAAVVIPFTTAMGEVEIQSIQACMVGGTCMYLFAMNALDDFNAAAETLGVVLGSLQMN